MRVTTKRKTTRQSPRVKAKPRSTTKKKPKAAPSRNGHKRPPLLVAIAPARAGDHIAVFDLLQHIFLGPSASEFHSSQDDPVYQPCDRLIARSDDRLLGHVQVVEREMKFGPLTLPVADLVHLGVLPEFRAQGVGTALVREAEAQMLAGGAKIGFVRTAIPQFFARHGWMTCQRQTYTIASTRGILARLSALAPAASNSPLDPISAPLVTRLWRQVEQDALARLYDAGTQGTFGPLVRTHAYWRWLFSRHAFDRIYVTLEGDSRLELDEGTSRIVGYAIVRDGWIIELMTAATHPHAARQLVARACSDAMEHDDAYLRFDGPPGHPLHKLLLAAGGRRTSGQTDGQQLLMAKLFDPQELLQALREALFQRAKASGAALPLELGLVVDGQKQQISVSRRSARLVRGKVGRSYLTCSSHVLARLVLGQTNVAEEAAAGRIVASTRVAAELAAQLFPPLPLWRPPLDQLPGR